MPDQLEHALRRRTELLASRSKAEVAAINALQHAYELLLPRDAKASRALLPGRIKRPQSAQLRPSSLANVTKRSSVRLEACPVELDDNCQDHEAGQASGDGIEVLELYASLVQLVGKLDATAKELYGEVSNSERKCRALQADPSNNLPPADPSELSPRLQVLHSVLGHQRFQQYIKDLHAEVAHLRRLYGGKSRLIIQEIAASSGKTISSEAVSVMLQQLKSKVTVDTQGMRVDDSEMSPMTMFPLIFRHCGDPQVPAQLSVEELDRLLRSMPEPREKIVRHTFEQLSDGWKGEGYVPPPDSIRAHYLHSVVKASFAHQQCSSSERDTIAAWINTLDPDGTGNAPVSVRDFLEFHHPKSDEFPLEDAEFVRYLLRIWCFDPSSSLATAPRTDRDAVARVILNSDERSVHERLMARKRELIGKIEGAQSGINNRAQQMRVHLGSLQRLEVKTASVSEWWDDLQFAEHLGASLATLRAFAAPGYSLSDFPRFLGSLAQLETLDLRDNRVSSIPQELGQLSALHRLDLSANCLSDASFSESSCAWCGLTALSELILRGNRLTAFPTHFARLKSLRKLDLADNAVRRVPKSVLKGWSTTSTLTSLDLHHNALTSLPEEIGLLRELRHLLLHENALSCLPVSVASLMKLEELTLWGNRLGDEFRELPVTDIQKQIALDRNCIREFPQVRLVSQSTCPASVVRISATHNQLRRLPTAPTASFRMCKELHLEHNSIRDIPDAFFESFPCLEELLLQHNRLQRVPASIVLCKSLRVIDIRANRLAEVPAALVELSQLEVLDLADNALQSIPVEWHGFDNHTRGPVGRRVLQTLSLRRNPIRNNVLQAVVDGTCRDGSSEIANALSNSSDRVCEGVLRKLIAGLRDAATNNAAFSCVASDSEEEDAECHRAVEAGGRRKWRGVTRDVNRYIAQRLRAMSRQHAGGGTSRLLVEVKSFERMIRSLPFACSKLELATLIQRLSVTNPEGKHRIDGDAFLAAIDSFKQSGSLSIALTTSSQRLGAKQTPDVVAPVLHYLSIMYRQQQSRKDGQRDQVRAESGDQAALQHLRKTPRHLLKVKQAAKVASKGSSSRMSPSTANKSSQARPEAAATAFVARVSASSRSSELVRQRQRIDVLKQQLMDHKLQLLHQTRQTSASLISSATMDANPSSSSDSDSTDNDRDGCSDAPGSGSDIICVRVSLLAAGTSAATTLTQGGRHLDVRVGALQTVLELKQRIEALARVPVGDQILIAKVGGKPVGLRLCNASTIQQSVRSEHRISEKAPWHLLLLLRRGV